MTLNPIGKENVVLYKGVGILLIVLHNFFHWVDPILGENEFFFARVRVQWLLDAIAQNPLEVVHLGFAFFGHFGVALFIFLSAYGLTRAYGDREISWGPFMRRRLARLYPVFVLGLLTHFLAFAVWQPEPWSKWLVIYALKLTLLTNFMPGFEFTVNGPWWFFSMIIQYYAVFGLLNAVTRKRPLAACLALGAVSVALNALVGPHLALNLRFTVLGWLPEIAFGIYLARAGTVRVPAPAVAALAAVAIAGNWLKPLWYLQSFSLTVLLLVALEALVNRREGKSRARAALGVVGTVSLALFATHGPLRLPFIQLANATNQWWATLLLGAAFLVAALAVAFVADRLAALFDRAVVKRTPTVVSPTK